MIDFDKPEVKAFADMLFDETSSETDFVRHARVVADNWHQITSGASGYTLDLAGLVHSDVSTWKVNVGKRTVDTAPIGLMFDINKKARLMRHVR